MDSQKILLSQMEAALAMLNRGVELCPDDEWQSKVVNLPVSTSAFHALFWTDLYLELSPDTVAEQNFHKENSDLFRDYEERADHLQKETYSKADVQKYFKFCHEKAIRVLNSETTESLAAPSGFYWITGNRAEVHVYNTRHIQHHAAQISMRLRINQGIDIPWVRVGFGKGSDDE